MNKYKTLLSNTVLISIGTFSSKVLVFLMVRFYTGYLTPPDYSTADLITQTANLLFPIISLGIADAVFRFALDHVKYRKDIFSAGLYTILFGSLMFVFIVPLLNLVNSFKGFIWLIVLYTMASCFHALCAQYVRAIGNTLLFSVQGLIGTAIVILLNILFLAKFHLGITGYVLSVALSDILCTIFLVFKSKLYKQITFRPKKSAVIKMLKYSIPLIPTTVFWWITSVSDRYMVNQMLGSGDNGIYTVAYKIPTILVLLYNVFSEAWQFSAVSESQTVKKEYIRFFSKVWLSFQAIMMLIASFLIAFSKIEISLLANPAYYTAWKYVPFLCMSMVFAAFVTFFGSIYVVEKKSMSSLWTALTGAVINIVFNFLLIKSPLGVQGAAISTLLSYFAVFLIRAENTHRMVPFNLFKGKLIIGTVIITLQSIAMVTEVHGWKIIQGVSILLLLLIYGKSVLITVKRVLGMFLGSKRKA